MQMGFSSPSMQDDNTIRINNMGWQTLEALKERKLNSWLAKGVITKQQYKDIIYICIEYGFWEALGYATRIKLKKKYEYKWINIPKKECKLNDYITLGKVFSNQKRRRIWRNIFFFPNGEDRIPSIHKQYPHWEIFYAKHGKYKIGLRREISNRLPKCSVPE